MVYESGRNKWYQSGRTSDCRAPFAVPALPSCDDTPFSKTLSSHFSSIPDMVSTNQLDFRDKAPSPASPSLPQVSAKFGASLEIPRVRFDGVLSVIISDCIYQISEDTLHQVFDPYGGVTNIIIRGEYPTLRALVYFDSFATASVAKIFLDGRNLYTGSCLLSIQFYFTDRLPMEVIKIFNPIAKSNLVEPPPKQQLQQQQETFFSGYSVADAQVVIDGSNGVSKDYNFGSFNDDNEPADFDYEGPCAVEDMFDPNGSFYFSAFNLNPMKSGIHSCASDVCSLELQGAVSPNGGNREVEDVISMTGTNENAPVFTIVNDFHMDTKAIGESGKKLKTFKVLIGDSMAQISKPFDYVGLFVKTAWLGNLASSFSETKLENLLKIHQVADGAPPSLVLYNNKNEITFVANRQNLVFDPGDSYAAVFSPVVVFSFGHDYVCPYRNPWGQGLFLGGGNNMAVRVALQRDDRSLVVDSLIGEKTYVELGTPKRFRELKLSLMFFVEFSGVFIDEDKTIAYLKVVERDFDCMVDGYRETMRFDSVTELHRFMESIRNDWSRDYLLSMGDILKIDHSFNHGFDPFIDDYSHQAQPAKKDIKIMSKYHFFPENDPTALASFLVEILMKLVRFIEFSGDFAALGAEFIVEYNGAAHVKDGMHMLAQLSAARALATALVSFSLVVSSYAHSLIIDTTLGDTKLRFGSTSQLWERKKMLLFLCYCFNVMMNHRACFGFIIAWRMILGDKDLFKEWGMSRPNTYVWAFNWAFGWTY